MTPCKFAHGELDAPSPGESSEDSEANRLAGELVNDRLIERLRRQTYVVHHKPIGLLGRLPGMEALSAVGGRQ